MKARIALASSVFAVCIGTALAAAAQADAPADGEHKVLFTEGHDTDPVDHGRPVVLIANALGVKPEVFREAFSHVHPAGPGSGGPTDVEARANKKALMEALAKYGVTDDRLNEVSNYYRYPPGGRNGKIWKHRDATAVAVVKDGKIVDFKITDAGAGYSSTPVIAIDGVPDAKVTAEVAYGKDLATNGAISKLSTDTPASKP